MDRNRTSRLSQTTTLDPATTGVDGIEEGPLPPEAWCLTVLYHPDPGRIGACFRWPSTPGLTVDLSRLEPLFTPFRGGAVEPLGEPHLSRSPIQLQNLHDGLLLTFQNDRIRLELNGRPAAVREPLDLRTVARGVLLTLSQKVSLMLHRAGRDEGFGAELGLLGISEPIARVREETARLATLSVPVLLTGESGVGKELVARAIHQLSARSARKLVSVNMAALPASTAVSELFGHARGAFTGAAETRSGLFGSAAGGTLFLDEIGETSSDVQPILLRAIESQEIQPLGSSPLRYDVRIIAATDSDLERQVQTGRFRGPLLFRLRTATLHVPPLRDRLPDIPPLLMHFLHEALGEVGALHRLEPGDHQAPWLRRREVLSLLRYAWPGNVRELRNVAFEIALKSHTRPSAVLPAWLEERLANPERYGPNSDPGGRDTPRIPWSGRSATEKPMSRNLIDATPAATSSGSNPEGSDPASKPLAGLDSDGTRRGERVRPADIDPARLREALEANNWRIGATAEQLGIARNSLYALMEQEGIRHAGQLDLREIMVAAQAEGSLDPERLAARLRVSPRGLKLRMRTLGLDT